MAKGYWIVNNTVNDLEGYKTYQAANAAPFKQYNAKFLVRAGNQEVREGDGLPRSVVLEFPSYADAVACYDSADYQAAKRIREDYASGTLIIVEGYDAE
ncbi:MAG: DUF1330 domain-containing protein [Pseudomonadota bacterium]